MTNDEMPHEQSQKKFILGAYYLIRSGAIQEWMPAHILPPALWSASRCVCDKLPDAWALTWVTDRESSDDRERYRSLLGLSDLKFLAFQNLFDKLFAEDQFGFPNVFMDYQVAKRIYQQFFAHIENVKLVSIALPEGFVQEFIDEFEPHMNTGENGVRKKLRQRVEVEHETQPIGYEVIGYDYADFHTLACCDAAEDAYNRYGIRFNALGLIDSFNNAVRIVDDIHMGNFEVEEGYWAPWLISEYPLH